MSADFDVNRATAIIERAIAANMFETMPASDADKIVEAEKLVELARQVEVVRNAWVAQGGEEVAAERVPHWPVAEEILLEANVFVGSDRAATNGSSVASADERPIEYQGDSHDLPSAPPSSGEEREPPEPASSAPTPGAPPTQPGGDAHAGATTTDPLAEAKSPQSVGSTGALKPAKGEPWEDAQGVEWEVLAYTGGPSVEVRKVSTGEQTVVPLGMLKRRIGHVQETAAAALQGDHEQESTNVIDSFTGSHEFLSNFSHSPIEIDGIAYQTVEHAFQAHKTLDPDDRRAVAAQSTPGWAKKAGRALDLRSDWEEVKVDVMRSCLELKFAPGGDLARRLDETGDVQLVEGNTWGDTYWGVCGGVGENVLGQLLMERREKNREQREPPPEPEVVTTPDPGRPDEPVDAPEPEQPSVPEHDDEGDDEYQRILADTEERYTPVGMPIPRDLADPPDVKPENFDEVDDRTARALHSRYNALAARAKYLHNVEDARARGCSMVRKIAMRGARREARRELGKDATVTELDGWAEDNNEFVRTWGDRARKHEEQASAWKTFFDIYTQHVVVLSRDWSMRDKQLNA